MPSQNPAHSTCALGLNLKTQATLPTRLQVIRKQVEGQKRTTPLSEEARLYTVIPNNSNQTQVAEFFQPPKRTTDLVTAARPIVPRISLAWPSH